MCYFRQMFLFLYMIWSLYIVAATIWLEIFLSAGTIE